MKAYVIAAALLATPVATQVALAAPRTYEVPEETAELAPGPNHDLAAGNCAGCHSADYIATQPRDPAKAQAFWQAEVTKMRAAYGAPLQDEDIPKIVEYLVAAYGK